MWRAPDQARAAFLALLLAALPGCGDRFAELDPRPAVANLFGAHLEGREPPPGLDQPWPSLSSVPPRPTPPDRAYRERLSAGLAQDRAQSRDALEPSGAAALSGGESGPPPRARLATAPAIRFDPEPLSRPAPAALPVPVPAPAPSAQPAPAPAQPAPARPAAAPQPSAPPPAPLPELLAPPPPPSRDLLAPRPN
ncbi:hypothetical protein [Falsiroseomonas sp.]|uniref:hypothetical protein n=1 Tax=Falsiroseomonas sp. TaxID=2870721 RepID=UPI003567604D